MSSDAPKGTVESASDDQRVTSDQKQTGQVIVEKLIDVDSPPVIPTLISNPLFTNQTPSQPTNKSITSDISALGEQLSPLKLEGSPTEQRDSMTLTPTPSDQSFASIKPEPIKQGDDGDSNIKKESCKSCDKLRIELDRLRADKNHLQKQVDDLQKDLVICRNDLDREVQKRVEFEQQFTEKSDRVRDQIAEFIAKSSDVDVQCDELRKRLEYYNRNSSTMSENFTTNREVLTSQLLELRNENDYLLGKYLSRARELQNADINLPQNVEELQFHCLTLYEKLILATMAKDRLEETLIRNSEAASIAGESSGSASSTSAPMPT